MKKYIYIAKPGIVFSNLFTFSTGFIVACHGYLFENLSLLFWSALGTTLALASSTTLNNYIDKDIDILMKRTHNRFNLYEGISDRSMITYILLLGILGFSILYIFVNLLTTLVVMSGYFIYIVLYSLYFKRKNFYSTFIGSFSGATVPLAGYTAFSNSLDVGALSLFLLLVVWQMPHFYAIGVYRLEDYKTAKIPILPVVSSIQTTKLHMFVWSLLFILVAVFPFFVFSLSYLYLVASILLSVLWSIICYRGFYNNNHGLWAKKTFFYSIFLLMLLCFILIFDTIIL